MKRVGLIFLVVLIVLSSLAEAKVISVPADTSILPLCTSQSNKIDLIRNSVVPVFSKWKFGSTPQHQLNSDFLPYLNKITIMWDSIGITVDGLRPVSNLEAEAIALLKMRMALVQSGILAHYLSHYTKNPKWMNIEVKCVQLEKRALNLCIEHTREFIETHRVLGKVYGKFSPSQELEPIDFADLRKKISGQLSIQEWRVVYKLSGQIDKRAKKIMDGWTYHQTAPGQIDADFFPIIKEYSELWRLFGMVSDGLEGDIPPQTELIIANRIYAGLHMTSNLACYLSHRTEELDLGWMNLAYSCALLNEEAAGVGLEDAEKK